MQEIIMFFTLICTVWKTLQNFGRSGWEDYIDSGNPVFIEWPEIIEAALEEEGFLPVRVIVMDNQDRIFNLGK